MTALQFINYAKKFIVALTAALGVLAIAIDGGITTSEWVQIVIAFAGALGVYTVPNTPKEQL